MSCTHEELDTALDRLAANSRADWPALAEVTQTDDLMGPLPYAGARVERGHWCTRVMTIQTVVAPRATPLRAASRCCTCT